MDSKEELYSQIENYLKGNLKGEELIAFEEAIKNDEELSKEVELHRSLQATFSKADENEFRTKVHQVIVEETTASNPVQRNLGWVRWVAAAAILFLVGIGIGKWLGSDTQADQLYSTHMDSYPVFSTTRSNSELAPILEEARELYEAESYDLALSTLNSLPAKDQSSASILFLKGITFIQMQEYEKARDAFTSISAGADSSNPFVDQAQWYSGLLYLKLGDVKKSKEVLKELSGKGGKYGKQAGELIVELD